MTEWRRGWEFELGSGFYSQCVATLLTTLVDDDIKAWPCLHRGWIEPELATTAMSTRVSSANLLILGHAGRPELRFGQHARVSALVLVQIELAEHCRPAFT